MKKYRIKVVEHHVDYVWVEAETKEKAEDKAIQYAQCQYELTYSSEWTGEIE